MFEMGWELETTTRPVARKDYHCQASDWIENSGLERADYSEEDWSTIEKARSESWVIKKGTQYLKTEGKWEGEFAVFRARFDLDEICQNHDIYQSC